MNKLIRLYNQNRAIFWTIVIIIAIILIVIQTLNYIVKQNNEDQKSDMLNNAINQANNQNTVISQGNVSTLTGETVKNSRTNEELIKEFVKCCNEGKADMAYNMLTPDCKEALYPSLERFKKDYVNRIFYITRLYGLENWYTTSSKDTYYVKYTENVLASRKCGIRR